MISVETPTTIHAVLEFANGALVTLGASWDVKAHGHRPMELYGTEASLIVPDPNFFGGEVQVIAQGGEARDLPGLEPSARRSQSAAWPGHDGQLPDCRSRRYGDCDHGKPGAPLFIGIRPACG
jgi:predicted dehydrogenase